MEVRAVITPRAGRQGGGADGGGAGLAGVVGRGLAAVRGRLLSAAAQCAEVSWRDKSISDSLSHRSCCSLILTARCPGTFHWSTYCCGTFQLPSSILSFPDLSS